MDKARQIIYSVMMGFVLKYFLEHVYGLNLSQNALSSSELWFYIIILIYFFINCFRYLFGIFRLTLMTDALYEPQKDDWVKSKFFFNLKRLFVMNSGIFQVTLFGVMVMTIFPHVDEVFRWKTEFLKADSDVLITKTNGINWRDIVFNFYLVNLIIVIIDVTTVFFFKNTVIKTNSVFDEKERMRCNVWIVAGIIEVLSFSIVIALMKTQEQINFAFQFGSILVLSILLIIEILGLWNYVIDNLIERFKNVTAK